MSKLTDFIKLITGRFDNKEQFDKMQAEGKTYPYAKHINTACNDKIKNLPENFNGTFVVEESYYKTDGKATHHRIFFLFQKIMKELYFLPTIFRMEKIRIHFLMIL